MNLSAAPATGPFRGALPFDESGASVFFGRQPELDAMVEPVVSGQSRVIVLAGESGAGRTSLLRAGLLPQLAHRGVLGLYVGDYADLEHELVQGASRMRADPPVAGEGAATYTARLARESPHGVVLVLDHVEELLRDDTPPERMNATTHFLREVLGAAGPSLRLFFSVESSSFPRLGRFLPRSVLSATGATFEIGRLSEDRAAAVIEQTVLQTGTFIEAGLASLMAADLCRKGPCLPLDLQLLARTVMELRLTSIRRYERSGGAAVLRRAFFDRIVREAGGRFGLKVLLELHDGAARRADELADRVRRPRAEIEHALSTLYGRGVVGKRESARGEEYVLLHPALSARVAEYAALELARVRHARQVLGQRALSHGRLSLLELARVSRHLGGALEPAEHLLVRRSIRRKLFHLSLGTLIGVAFLVVLFMDLRTSYTLRFAPAGAPEQARVVVAMGKPGRRLLALLPHQPRFGALIADTGFSAAGLSSELAARIARGEAVGKLERAQGGPAVMPGWLRTTLSGMQPLVRGTASILLGDPAGVVALKQSYAEPATRRDTLDVLRVVGRGGAGEDEILAAALSDPAPELRKRAVEVAAAIDRRTGNGVHATTLRAALADGSPSIREAVVTECASLPPGEAADILAVAFKGADLDLRKRAEEALLALAARDPAATARAAIPAAVDSDSLLRRSALALLDAIVRRDATGVAPLLAQLVADAATPEDTRIGALRLLRTSGAALETLREVVARAVAPDAPPRLRAAALPLHAQLIPPAEAQELAVAEARGQVLARASAAAIWGVLAEHYPEAAGKALKVALFDGAPEVRVEAARAAGNLRRDGLALAQRALLDGNAEVTRAGLDAVVALARFQAPIAIETLSKALRLVRPALRPALVEALGEAGRDRPALVLPPLLRAFKEGTPTARTQVARTLCGLTARDAAATAPVLRVIARDADREVRAAVAGCLVPLAAADARGALRIAEELTQAGEAEVRAAVAATLPALTERSGETALGTILSLLGDGDPGVRAAALAALDDYGARGLSLGRRAADAQTALTALLARAGRAERLQIVSAAARNRLAPLLRQAARERDDAVRIEGLRGVALLDPPDVELLREGLHADSPAVRAEAMKLLVSATQDGAADVLPVFEAMLRSSDLDEQISAAQSLGALVGAEAGVVALLQAQLSQRSEALRRNVTAALGAIAARAPALARPSLERALEDPAHDVRTAAAAGLAVAWAGELGPAEVARTLEESETDSRRRFVGLEALLHQARDDGKRAEAERELKRVGEAGPPLARLAARVGLAFLDAPSAEFGAFMARLLGH